MALNGHGVGAICLAAWLCLPAPARADEALASNPAAIISSAEASAGDHPITAVTSGNLIGRDVTSARDQLVGEIESVYVDDKGNVRQVIVTGVGDHPVAIDWKDVVVSESGRKLAVSASKDQVLAQPQYHYAKPEQQGTVFTDDEAAKAP